MKEDASDYKADPCLKCLQATGNSWTVLTEVHVWVQMQIISYLMQHLRKALTPRVKISYEASD